MTKPKPLPIVARSVVETVHEKLEDLNAEWFNVVLYIHAGEIEQAVRLLRDMKCATDVSEKALQLPVDGKVSEAEAVLVKSKKSR
jgi:hypothetical protein